jgi:hypothetical protein
MKKAAGFLLLITLLFSLAGCAGQKPSEITIDEILKYNNAKYSITKMQWLNNDDVFIQTIHLIKPKESSLAINKICILNTKTNKAALFYEGNHNTYFMEENTLTLCGDNKMYVYNAEFCLLFHNRKLEKSYDLKDQFDKVFGEKTYEGTSLNINKYGECCLLYKGDIVTFSLDDVENYKVLIKKTDELRILRNDDYYNLPPVPATHYWMPLWSPDGKWILYYERDSIESHDGKVVIYNIETEEKKSFDFKYMDTYRWAGTSNYVVGSAALFVNNPELKVYNLKTDECRSFILDGPVNGINFQSVHIEDVVSNEILLSCFRKNAKPLLMLNFETGGKRWATETNYTSSDAVTSPDKDKIISLGKSSPKSNDFSLKVFNID